MRQYKAPLVSLLLIGLVSWVLFMFGIWWVEVNQSSLNLAGINWQTSRIQDNVFTSSDGYLSFALPQGTQMVPSLNSDNALSAMGEAVEQWSFIKTDPDSGGAFELIVLVVSDEQLLDLLSCRQPGLDCEVRELADLTIADIKLDPVSGERIFAVVEGSRAYIFVPTDKESFLRNLIIPELKVNI